MSSTDKNPPAFPSRNDERGMSLRDYFAARAMQAFVFEMVRAAAEDAADHHPTDAHELLCAVAYKIADAMLKERAR